LRDTMPVIEYFRLNGNVFTVSHRSKIGWRVCPDCDAR
jgi:hypothetical protein